MRPITPPKFSFQVGMMKRIAVKIITTYGDHSLQHGVKINFNFIVHIGNMVIYCSYCIATCFLTIVHYILFVLTNNS